MQAALTLADARQDIRLLHLRERFTLQATSQFICRRQSLANVTETWRSSRTSTPGERLWAI
jgi:hypothetical protein